MREREAVQMLFEHQHLSTLHTTKEQLIRSTLISIRQSNKIIDKQECQKNILFLWYEKKKSNVHTLWIVFTYHKKFLLRLDARWLRDVVCDTVVKEIKHFGQLLVCKLLSSVNVVSIASGIG